MKKVVKSDTVLILSGNDRGKTGKVLKVFPAEDKVIVEGVRLIKKHMRPSQKLPQGGIVEKEAPIHISNVKVVCPKCNQPTRVGFQQLENKNKVRFCKNQGCGEII